MSLILLISPVTTHPRKSGWNERVYQITEAVRKLGYETFFCLVDLPGFEIAETDDAFSKYWGNNYTRFKTRWKKKEGYWTLPYRGLILIRLKEVIVKLLKLFRIKQVQWLRDIQFTNQLCPKELSIWLEEFCNTKKPTAVIMEYVFMAKAFKNVPGNITTIIDTHDVFAERNKRITNQGIPTRWFNLYKWQEKRLLSKADYIIAIQQWEGDYFLKQLNRKNKVYVLDILQPATEFQNITFNKDIGFVASANDINYKSIQWFITEVLPLIIQKESTARLKVAGSVCRLLNSNHPQICLDGFVTDIATFYESCKVIINPCLGGTGLKIKSVEALRYGKPLVVTSAGIEGLNTNTDAGFIIANEKNDFAEKCYQVLENDSLSLELSKQAKQFINKKSKYNLSVLKELIEP